MAKRVKFVLNRKNFREQILKRYGAEVISDRLGEDAEIDVTPSGERARGRIYGRMSDEAENGTLSRKLGGL